MRSPERGQCRFGQTRTKRPLHAGRSMVVGRCCRRVSWGCTPTSRSDTAARRRTSRPRTGPPTGRRLQRTRAVSMWQAWRRGPPALSGRVDHWQASRSTFSATRMAEPSASRARPVSRISAASLARRSSRRSSGGARCPSSAAVDLTGRRDARQWRVEPRHDCAEGALGLRHGGRAPRVSCLMGTSRRGTRSPGTTKGRPPAPLLALVGLPAAVPHGLYRANRTCAASHIRALSGGGGIGSVATSMSAANAVPKACPAKRTASSRGCYAREVVACWPHCPCRKEPRELRLDRPCQRIRRRFRIPPTENRRWEESRNNQLTGPAGPAFHHVLRARQRPQLLSSGALPPPGSSPGTYGDDASRHVDRAEMFSSALDRCRTAAGRLRASRCPARARRGPWSTGPDRRARTSWRRGCTDGARHRGDRLSRQSGLRSTRSRSVGLGSARRSWPSRCARACGRCRARCVTRRRSRG